MQERACDACGLVARVTSTVMPRPGLEHRETRGTRRTTVRLASGIRHRLSQACGKSDRFALYQGTASAGPSEEQESSGFSPQKGLS